MNVIPLDSPIIAFFSFLTDCQVKIAVSIKEKNGLFYLKNPIKPPTEWKMNLIIRSIDFPVDYPIKLMLSPFNETDYWQSSIHKKIAHSEFAEIYEISPPTYLSFESLRKSIRIFCLLPIECQLEGDNVFIPATCVDISEDGSGLGLRFDRPIHSKVGMKCLLRLQRGDQYLPEIVGKIVRQSISGLNNCVSVGIVVQEEYKNNAVYSVKHILEILQENLSKEKTTFFNNIEYPPLRGINDDFLDLLN